MLRSHQRRTAADSAAYLLPHLKPGLSVLDVGCGPGTITADLAARVTPGSVTAVDQSAGVLGVARAEVQQHGLSNVSFATADVHRLDFPDGTFDVVHAHQVLQHVADPGGTAGDETGVRARRHRGGPGTPTMRGSSGSRSCRRWIRGASFTSGPLAPTAANPVPGRRLLSWAQQAGFADVTPTGSVWCYATPATREWWGGMWADRILHSRVARDLLDLGLATTAQLEEISCGVARLCDGPGRPAVDPTRRNSLPGVARRGPAGLAGGRV